MVVAAARSGLRDSSAAASGRGTARTPTPTTSTAGAEKSSRVAKQEPEGTGSGGCAVGLGERGHRASRPSRAHHGQLLGHRGPAVRAARVSASHR